MTHSAQSVLCGSLSLHPVSIGAAMHRAGYAALGLDWSYVPFRVQDLGGALTGMRALGIRGFGVSMPYKIQILPLLDAIDPSARAIGAVNTVVNDGGWLTGFNTDAEGARRALAEVLQVRGARVLVIGAGGAARAVTYGLVSAGARVHIVNRQGDRAESVARAVREELGAPVGWGPLSDGAELRDFDAVVNASSAGMVEYGSASPVPLSALRPDLVVLDIVYKPIETELLRAARAIGCTTAHGGRMLLHQAARQFELYTGLTAPLTEMDAALRAALAAG